MMDRTQVILVGLPLFLLCTDIFNLFLVSPPTPLKHPHPHPHHHHHQPPVHQTLDPFPVQQNHVAGGIGAPIGFGHTIRIDFCSSCSYRGNAVTMKNMLETAFPGISVVLSNYPPPLPKQILGKVLPVFQFGVIGIVMAGEHIFPRVGYVAPPPWYYSLRANRFGTISTTWLLGNVLQSFLQSSGAFEVHVDGQLVFSKLKEQRFPGEIELKDLVGRKIAVFSRNTDSVGGGSLWS